ncbi:MAG: diacylglycerol kinase [Planctomycetaceae bacterium]
MEVERGVAAGVRSDSTFFVHFFIASVIVAASLVLGLSVLQWTIVVLTLTMVLTAEMFQQVLKTILAQIGHHFPEAAKRAERIGAAAVFVSFLGAVITIGLIFSQRLSVLFTG